MTEYTVTPATVSRQHDIIIEDDGHENSLFIMIRNSSQRVLASALVDRESFGQMIAQYSEHHCPPARETRELREELREELRIANARIKELHRMLIETGKLTVAGVPIHGITPTTAEQRRAVKLALNSLYGKNLDAIRDEINNPLTFKDSDTIQGRTPYTVDELFELGFCTICGVEISMPRRETHTDWHNDVADL